MTEGIEKIELIGENGEREEFIIDAFFQHNGNEYVVLSKEDVEDALMLKLKYNENKEPEFIQIDSDNEFNEALEEYLQLI